jgi:hypothetical protein
MTRPWRPSKWPTCFGSCRESEIAEVFETYPWVGDPAIPDDGIFKTDTKRFVTENQLLIPGRWFHRAKML